MSGSVNKYNTNDHLFECSYITPLAHDKRIHYQALLEKIISRLFITSFNPDGTLKNNPTANMLILRAVPGSKTIRDELIVNFTKAYVKREVRIVFNASFQQRSKHEHVVELARAIMRGFEKRVATASVNIATSQLKARLEYIAALLLGALPKTKETALPDIYELANAICAELKKVRNTANLTHNGGRLNIALRAFFTMLYANAEERNTMRERSLFNKVQALTDVFFPEIKLSDETVESVLAACYTALKGNTSELENIFKLIIKHFIEYIEQRVKTVSKHSLPASINNWKYKLVIQKRDDAKARVFDMLNE